METGHCSESSDIERSLPIEGREIVRAPDRRFVSSVTPDTDAMMSDAWRLVGTAGSEDMVIEAWQRREMRSDNNLALITLFEQRKPRFTASTRGENWWAAEPSVEDV